MTIISSDINKAIQLLSKGELVAIPTETVYGLAGNIFNEQAIKTIYKVKQRPLYNPLIVHVHAIEQAETLVSDFPEKARLLAKKFWPGPLTLILKKNPLVPGLVTAGKDSVAIRIPNHPIALNLLRGLSFPIAAPSANPFNRISPTKSKHVEDYFKNDIPMVLEGGDCKKGIESTIVGFENGEAIVYRLGSLELEQIEAVIGKVSIKNRSEQAPTAPGMLAKHYAPRTKMVLVDMVEDHVGKYETLNIGVLKLSGTMNTAPNIHTLLLSKTGDLSEAATNLYESLHRLDSLNLDIIIAERLPDYGLGKTINDRLERAAK